MLSSPPTSAASAPPTSPGVPGTALAAEPPSSWWAYRAPASGPMVSCALSDPTAPAKAPKTWPLAPAIGARRSSGEQRGFGLSPLGAPVSHDQIFVAARCGSTRAVRVPAINAQNQKRHPAGRCGGSAEAGNKTFSPRPLLFNQPTFKNDIAAVTFAAQAAAERRLPALPHSFFHLFDFLPA